MGSDPLMAIAVHMQCMHSARGIRVFAQALAPNLAQSTSLVAPEAYEHCKQMRALCDVEADRLAALDLVVMLAKKGASSDEAQKLWPVVPSENWDSVMKTAYEDCN